MESEHRKIELQSPADLTFLTTQLRTAARRKLDLHLPPVSDTSEPDELRKTVEELVDAFIAQVLAGMRNNISINGIDVVQRGREGDEVDAHGDKMEGIVEEGASLVEKEEYEVFDEKLRSKVGTTIAKRDALIAKISQHRRTTPAAAAATFQTQFARETDAMLQAQNDVVVEEDGLADVAALVRGEEVRRNWERAIEGLSRLNKGLPETRARLERAGDVVGYLGGSVEQK
jgi:kinetochor protein Mis14/NSL1